MMMIITITIKLAVVFSQTLWNLFSHCCCVLWQYCLGEVSRFCFDRSLVILVFLQKSISYTTLPSLQFSTQCFPFTLASRIIFLVIVIVIVDIVLLNAKIPKK